MIRSSPAEDSMSSIEAVLHSMKSDKQLGHNFYVVSVHQHLVIGAFRNNRGLPYPLGYETS
jgi:hypothetical protein